MSDYRNIPLGALPDKRDPRDVLKARAVAPIKLPYSSELDDVPPIKNQGRQGSCTGQAVAWMWEQILASRNMARFELSPLYLWYFGRLAEGNADRDAGVSMREAIGALHKYGVCPLSDWPNNSPIDVAPSPLARAYGANFRLPRYVRCATLDDIRYSIAVERQSVVIGLPVFENWYSDQVVRTGMVPMPQELTFLGYHALAVCGYDDRFANLKMANSWGREWGNDGYCWVPYELLAKYSFDAWTADYDALPNAV